MIPGKVFHYVDRFISLSLAEKNTVPDPSHDGSQICAAP